MGTNMNDTALGSESLFILALSSMAEVFIILRPSPILSDLMFGPQPRKNVITTSRWIKLCISDEALMTTTKKSAIIMFNHKARSRKGVSEEIGITQTEINPHASDLSEYFVNHVNLGFHWYYTLLFFCLLSNYMNV